MSTEQQLITWGLAFVAAAIPTVLAWFKRIQAKEDADRAEALLRQARAERELAQLAAHEAAKEKDAIIALGAALGASFERGAPPPRE